MEQREEQLSYNEKRRLRLRAIFVTLFGLIIGSLTAYMLFFFKTSGSLGFPVYLFAFFFFGILAFILFVHIRNAFQESKNVYTGTITDKREHTMTTRKEIGQTTYSVILDDRSFSVDLALYNKIHRGDQVELHCLKGTIVFEAIIVNPASAQPLKSEAIVPETADEMTETGHSVRHILLKALSKAVVIHVLIYGIVAFFLIFALNLLAIILIEDKTLLPWLIQGIFYGIILFWGMMNVSTFRLLLDVFSRKTQEKIETVRDMQSGNLPKPSRNSVRTYQGFYYRNDIFYYVQTDHHWLEISPDLYLQLKTGERLLLICGHYSGTVLHIRKTNAISI